MPEKPSAARPSAPQRRAPQPRDTPQRAPLRAEETRIPGAPGELTGIRFAADLARMLPAEAALLRHPIGRRLWRARHAEGRLLAHDSQAVLTDWRPDPNAAARGGLHEAPPEPRAHGPFILCLDTSGSMRGAPEQIAKAVAIAKFPPDGVRGASLCRATGFGSHFAEYFSAHNRDVVVVVMLEHVDAVRNAKAILATPGIDAALIGPYDLSASMGLAGQLDHPDVLAAQASILEACLESGVAPGLHVVPVDPAEVRRRLDQGFRFLPCGLDTLFIREGCRRMLAARNA